KTQHRTGGPWIYVLYYSTDLRTQLFYLLHKSLCPRKYGGSCDQHYKNFVCQKTVAHQNVAHQSGMPVLVIRLVSTNANCFPNSADRLIQLFLMKKAGICRKNILAPLRIDSADQLPSRSLGKSRDCLVSVMPWIFHTYNRQDFSVVSEKFLYRFPLFLKLFFIRHI